MLEYQYHAIPDTLVRTFIIHYSIGIFPFILYMYTLFVLDTYIIYISFSLVLPSPSSPRVSSPETAGWRTEPAVLGVSDIKHSTRMNLEERANPPPPPPPASPITGWAGLQGRVALEGRASRRAASHTRQSRARRD